MTQKISLNHIAKVEGHGSLAVEIDNGKVKKCELMAIEGARFFEGIVVGHKCDEAKEITTRICGICSCGHAATSIKAVNNALGLDYSRQSEMLLELMTIGERIRSHAMHLYMFALPDYLGYESAIAMAARYPKKVKLALKLIGLGNDIIRFTCGREMHPVACLPGGWTKVPTESERSNMLTRLKEAKNYVLRTGELFAKLGYPDFVRECEHISLKQEKTFPLINGRLISTSGLDIKQEEYEKFISEYLEDYSTSKFALKEGKGYMTGALPRLNNNFKELSDEAAYVLKQSGVKLPSFNPFHNNLAQAIEIVHWWKKAIDIASKPFKFEGLPNIKGKAGRGIAMVEVPRGMCMHDYTIDKDGRIVKANIITPTSQNLRNLQDDVHAYLQQLLDEKIRKDKIIFEIEKLIRAYDPCFSCSTHFLKVDWKEN